MAEYVADVQQTDHCLKAQPLYFSFEIKRTRRLAGLFWFIPISQLYAGAL